MILKKILLPLVLALMLPAAVLAQTESGVYAEITTTKGVMLFRLDTENTPATAANFVGLAEGFLYNESRNGVPFYDGLLFYRVIPQYAVFSGDPLGNGNGGPGFTLYREKNPSLSAANRGVLMMNGLPQASHGSQFFITNGSDAFLDTKFTAFGMIVSGLEILDKITDDDTILGIKIIRRGEAAEQFALNEPSVVKIMEQRKQAYFNEVRKTNPALVNQVETLGKDARRTLTGIWYTILKKGSGPILKNGQTAVVHYQGTLLDGTVFDSSWNRGQPLELAIGRQPMIPGWLEALMSMNAGEKRRIILPPEFAYGDQGYGPIPPGAWLVFEIELVEIR